MPGRTTPIQTAADLTSAGTKPYRYGFNGQESDFEINNQGGSSYTADYWQYDSRLGRRWNIDPVVKEWESPYSTFANNPIWLSDQSGSDTISFNNSSTSFQATPSKLDGYPSFQPSGSSNFSINIIPSDGEDVFYYTRSHTHIDVDGTTATTSSTTQLSPNTPDSRSGVTQGTNMMFDGMISWQEDDLDSRTIGKFMNSSSEFSNYMTGRNGNAKMWQTLATGQEFMEGIFPTMTWSIATAIIPAKGIVSGGQSFDQYKNVYWSIREKPLLRPIVNPSTGQVYKVYMELHHKYIPQRAAWAPNWLKNNSWNLKPLNSIEHGLEDAYRFQFFPKWVKEGVRNGTIGL